MLKPVKTVYNKKWIPYKSKLDFYLDNKRLEFDGPMTTVHGFFYNENDHLLLVKHIQRGWEIPGGHVEEQEGFEDAMKRELYEEAQMFCLAYSQLGYLRKKATESKPQECNYPYPLSYCLFYTGKIDSGRPFTGDESIEGYKFVSEVEARQNPWIQTYEEYYDASLKLL